MKLFGNVLFCFLIVATSIENVIAAENSNQIGIIARAGTVGIGGDLSQERSASAWGTSVLLLSGDKSRNSDTLGGIGGFFTFDFGNIDVKSKENGPFPFKGGESLSIFESAFIPNICAFLKWPIQTCIGAGWSHLELSDTDNKQNYSAFRYEARIGRFFTDGLIGGVGVHYSDLTQKVAGESSKFSLLSYQGSIGWSW